MTKHETLAKMLAEFGMRDEMLGIPFKPRAYQLASESVTALKNEVEAAWRRGGKKEVEKLPGIGPSIAEKIDEFYRTGKIQAYERMKKTFPVDIWGLSRIEGLGPKHILDLFKRLKIKNLNDLRRALRRHEIQNIPRWGEKSEEKLMRGLGLLEHASGRRLLGDILPIAEGIVKTLESVKGVKRVAIAGSLRRMQETVGDIDLLATSSDPIRVMDVFINLPLVESIHERGKTRSSARLKIGIDADLRVVPDKVYGAALQYFTGDKRHNVLLREYALSKGFTLSEYGLFRRSHGARSGKPKLVACRTEEDIYAKLGMDTPPPEIRVGDDEIEAAQEHRLPNLVPYGSVRGDLQIQTEWTDGSASIKDMAKAAQAAGLSYMAVTDHTKSLGFINGLDEKRLAKQGAEIDKLNKKIRGFTILKGTECDIRKDGSLDLSDVALASLDWVGISIHSAFQLSRAAQTKRIIKALSNPHVDCFFHPTCRLIGKREPIEFDFDEILAAAKKFRVALEIDAYPDRSDLNDLHVRAAVKAGVMLAIDTDAHAPEHFRFIRLGEAIARRGWASNKNILNTRTAKQVLAYLAKKKNT